MISMVSGSEVLDIVFGSLCGFILGALPAAYVTARAHGVNIFEVGTHQAGATNVYRNVNRRAGLAVFAFDAGKGIMSIYIARHVFQIDGAWVLLPCTATIVGHWNSPFTRLRGGDGVASLGGIAVGLFGWASLVPVIILALVMGIFKSRFAHPSLWGGLAAWMTFLVVLLFWSSPDSDALLMFTGLSVISIAILLHSVVFHLRHREYFRDDD